MTKCKGDLGKKASPKKTTETSSPQYPKESYRTSYALTIKDRLEALREKCIPVIRSFEKQKNKGQKLPVLNFGNIPIEYLLSNDELQSTVSSEESVSSDLDPLFIYQLFMYQFTRLVLNKGNLELIKS